MDKSTCSIGGCVSVATARDMCVTHYSRWRRTGDPGAAERKYLPRSGLCSVDGCEYMRDRRGLCQKHYMARAARGSVHLECLYCGEDMTNRDRARKFCSKAHGAMYRRHGGARAMEKECARCGGMFSIAGGDSSSRAKRADVKMCAECKRARTTRHGWSVRAIVALKGTTDCGLCSEPVDLTLQAPNLMRPSIDHIVPFAHGGSNDLGNLQLSHLHCNFKKSDRVIA